MTFGNKLDRGVPIVPSVRGVNVLPLESMSYSFMSRVLVLNTTVTFDRGTEFLQFSVESKLSKIMCIS